MFVKISKQVRQQSHHPRSPSTTAYVFYHHLLTSISLYFPWYKKNWLHKCTTYQANLGTILEMQCILIVGTSVLKVESIEERRSTMLTTNASFPEAFLRRDRQGSLRLTSANWSSNPISRSPSWKLDDYGDTGLLAKLKLWFSEGILIISSGIVPNAGVQAASLVAMVPPNRIAISLGNCYGFVREYLCIRIGL